MTSTSIPMGVGMERNFLGSGAHDGTWTQVPAKAKLGKVCIWIAGVGSAKQHPTIPSSLMLESSASCL